MFRIARLFAFLILLQGCAGTYRQSPKQTTTQQYVVNAQQPPDQAIDGTIKPLRDSLDKLVNEVLITSDAELLQGGTKVLKPAQLAMGNFLVDATLAIGKQQANNLGKPEPDISIFTWGSCRSALPAGEITLRHIYQLMPFENEMVVLKLTGNEVKTLLDQLAVNKNPIAGATISKGDVNTILVQGKPLEADRVYYVLASDYLAFGGDNTPILKDVSEKYFSDIKVRDALVQYLRKLKAAGKTLMPNYEERIK
jgi:2',3'-cyclic-nucleotide 2'-phosphodiesterase (5'-nucleotidase family)